MSGGLLCAGVEGTGNKIAPTVEQWYKLTAAYSSVATAGPGTLSSLYFAPALRPAPAAFLLLGAMVPIPNKARLEQVAKHVCF